MFKKINNIPPRLLNLFRRQGITQKKAYNNIPILIFSPLESWGCFVARISVHGPGTIKELFAKRVIFFTASMQLE
jgi:hypothetical protein